MRLLAPAKINLHLRVAPVTSDGFHPLLSWMCTVGLFDILNLNRADASGIEMRCDDPSLPCDGTNLVVRAAVAMRNEAALKAPDDPGLRHEISACESSAGQALPRRTIGEDGLVEKTASAGKDGPAGKDGLAIELLKRIPTGGGLGGGSSDAARVVMGLNRLWGLKLPVDRLSAVSAMLGSDVAFFCHGASSVCVGRGQIVRPIGVPMPRWVVLIFPPMAVPTGPVYRRFDEMLSEEDRRLLSQAVAIEPDWQKWLLLRADELLPQLVNDLERPAFDLYPALARLREQLEQLLGRIVRMSGSGSSLFTLFDNADAAEDAAEKIVRSAQHRALAVMLAPHIEDDLAGHD